MLILTRYPNEKIMIQVGNELITVQVLEVKNNRVSIGVTAPKNVPVHREEIYKKIQRGETKP